MKGKEVILGILHDRPRTGYEINEIIQSRLAHFFDGTYGMIYPTLKKLEQEGFVIKEQVSQSDKPNKNVYTITKEGIDYFQQAMLKPTADEVFKSDFLMRMYFSEYLDDQQVLMFIKEELKRKRQKLDSLESLQTQWVQSGMTKAQKVTFDYGVAYYQSAIQVLKEALKEFSSSKKS